MVSTVTVSTVAIVAGASLAAGAALFATIFLIGFLVTKELAGASGSSVWRLVSRSLTIGIIPLLIGFCVIVGLKVLEILA